MIEFLTGAWDFAVRLLFYFILPLGPAAFMLSRWNSQDENTPANKLVYPNQLVMALMWTAAVVVYLMFRYEGSDDKLKNVCQRFEQNLRDQKLGDTDWDLATEQWWYDCHPEDEPAYVE